MQDQVKRLSHALGKTAVNGLVKTAALELAAVGIRVNGIARGLIDNRMLASIADQLAPGAAESVIDGIMPQVPLQRLGRSEEIAQLALFLASDECFMTGQNLQVNGGLTLRRNPTTAEIENSVTAAKARDE